MAKIIQLSPHVADLIAAGEVVERPGSVVKELLENSIDAGARHITAEIQNGGMTLIRISDDGCGMERQDAQTAFLRHATSKIRREEDLAAIGTLGFRGEALAAISSVSRITLLTRPQDSLEGTSLALEGGTITACDPAGCPKGTTIVVRDLFYNTPARLKFMKSDVSEGAAVFSAVQKQAISHPEISFRFLKDGEECLNTPGDGLLRSVLYEVLGRQTSRDLTEVNSRWEDTAVSGFVSLPTATRGNRGGQTFFVNGRYVKSRTMTAALEEAYKNQIMVGRFPLCVLNVQVPLRSVDVNVHPAKTEVRFLSEKNIFDCIYYGVLSALGKASGKKDAVFPTAQKAAPQATVSRPSGGETPFRRMTAEEYRAMTAALDAPPVSPSKAAVRALTPAPASPAAHPPAALHEPVQTPRADPSDTPLPVFAPKAAAREPELSKAEAPVQETMPQDALPEVPAYRVVGEVLHSYILVEEPGAVLFIDKHAAHERILFEKLKKQDTRAMSQLLLSPIPAALSREDAAVLLEQLPLLRECGFELEDFGDHTILIRAVPDDVAQEDAEAVLAAMASDLLCGKRSDPDGLRDSLLHTIACKAAIKAGWQTEPAELDALVREVMTRDDLKYCPHGRPICLRMTDGALRRQFKRS